MPAKVSHGIIDNSGEVSVTSFHLPDLTAANYDTVAGNGVGENVGELRLGVASITLGNFTRHSVQAVQYPEAGTIPANKFAQREIKALFTCVDNVNTKKFTFTVPAPDLNAIATEGTDVLDLVGNATLAAFKATVELYAVSPDGNALTILSGRTVGRNN